jgi:hypothetical protein
LLEQLEVEGEIIVSDSTGYRPTPASAHYRSRRGQACREWIKGLVYDLHH